MNRRRDLPASVDDRRNRYPHGALHRRQHTRHNLRANSPRHPLGKRFGLGRHDRLFGGGRLRLGLFRRLRGGLCDWFRHRLRFGLRRRPAAPAQQPGRAPVPLPPPASLPPPAAGQPTRSFLTAFRADPAPPREAPAHRRLRQPAKRFRRPTAPSAAAKTAAPLPKAGSERQHKAVPHVGRDLLHGPPTARFARQTMADNFVERRRQRTRLQRLRPRRLRENFNQRDAQRPHIPSRRSALGRLPPGRHTDPRPDPTSTRLSGRRRHPTLSASR